MQYPGLAASALEQQMSRANKHKRPVCKDSRATNFNNIGVHYEELCIYDNAQNLYDNLEEAKNILLDMQAELAEREVAVQQTVSTQTTTPTAQATTSNYTPVYTQTANVSVSSPVVTSTLLVDDLSEAENLEETEDDLMLATEEPEEEVMTADESTGQTASILDAQSGSDSSRFSPLF